MLIYMAFDREPYTKGPPQGPTLLLRILRGETINWHEIEQSLQPKKKCSQCQRLVPKHNLTNNNGMPLTSSGPSATNAYKQTTATGTPPSAHIAPIGRMKTNSRSHPYHTFLKYVQIVKKTKEDLVEKDAPCVA